MDSDIFTPHLKKIQINPTLFSPGGGSGAKTAKNKTRKRKIRPEVNTEEVRAQLLQNIKERTANSVKTRPSIPIPPSSVSNTQSQSQSQSLSEPNQKISNKPLSEYELSIQYMQERKSQLTKQKRTRMKTPSTQSSVTVGGESKEEKGIIPLGIGTHTSTNITHRNIPLHETSVGSSPAPYKIDNAVPHGCLKGGLKKTYKNISSKIYPSNSRVQFTDIEPIGLPESSGITITYVSDQNIGNAIPSLDPIDLTLSDNTTTIDTLPENSNTKTVSLTTNSIQSTPEHRPSTSTPTLPEKSSENTTESMSSISSISSIYPTYTQNTQHIPSNPSSFGGGSSTGNRFHKVHKTYRLGKNSKSKIVSVFCKNVNMINGLKKMQTTIKNVSIPNMKRFLVKKSLISIGSSAPTDVIKHMYESCILSGDVVNHNDKVLLDNYLNNP